MCYISLHICQVNGVSVVKVGHRQVVSLIRQGGSRLVMKVVSVTRKPDTGEVVRKKGSYPQLTSYMHEYLHTMHFSFYLTGL